MGACRSRPRSAVRSSRSISSTIARIEGANADRARRDRTSDDQARLEAAVRALDPSIRVIAAAKVWKMSQAEQIEYVRQRGLGVPAPADASFEADDDALGPLDLRRRPSRTRGSRH